MKRFIKVMWLAAILTLALAAACVAEGFDATPITPGVRAEAVIDTAGSYAYFSFTPQTTDTYLFYSTGSADTYGYLYDSNGNQLASNDDGGLERNFWLSYLLEGGNTYYFGARYYRSSNTGTFSVMLTVDNQLTVSEGRDYYIHPGDSLDLSVSASCRSGGLSYQWYMRYYDGEADEWSDYAPISGATGATYRESNLIRRTDYRCVVKDTFGNEAVADFEVFIDNELTVEGVGGVGYDEDYTVYYLPGERVTLSVEASCYRGGLSYQWYTNSEDDDEDYTAIDGATAASYALYPVEGHYYRCEVRDDYGNSKSRWFYPRVDNGFYVDDDEIEVKVAYGEPAVLRVSAHSDDGDLSYYWYEEDWVELDDANSATYTVAAVTGLQTYACGVSDGYDDITVFFSVGVENGLTAAPVGETRVSRTVGQPLTLSVTASCNSGALSYSWHRDYYNISDDEWDDGIISGATSPSYTLENSEAYGNYYCTVRDIYDNEVRIEFNVELDAELILSAVGGNFRALQAGATAQLEVAASGCTEGLRYRWYRGNNEIENTNSAAYTTPAITSTTRFSCYAENKYGQGAKVDFLCTVLIPTLTLNEVVSLSIPSGESRYYTFTPTATDDYTLESFGNEDSIVRLFNSDLEIMDGDDDGGDRFNFCLTCRLTAGKKYYFEVEECDGGAITFAMKLTRGDSASGSEANYPGTLYLRKGQTVSAHLGAHYDECDLRSMVSSQPSVVSVSGDRLTAAGNGSAVITVVHECGWTGRYNVIVEASSAIALPVDLREIEAHAFAGDASVKYALLSDQVASIGSDAFNGSGLRQIYIPGRNTVLRGVALRGADVNLTIICREGSIAEQYARRYGIECLYIVD